MTPGFDEETTKTNFALLQMLNNNDDEDENEDVDDNY